MPDIKVSLLTAVTALDVADQFYVVSSGTSKKVTVSSLRTGGYAKVEDQKAEGTTGGMATLGSYQVRDLNTIVEDVDGIVSSLSSNRITLVAGTYRCRIRCPSYAVNRNRARLYNFTDSVKVLQGSAGQHGTSTSTDAWIVGKFTIAASKALEIQHRFQLTTATYGLGVPSGDQWAGDGVEVFTEAEFWKIG